MSNSKIYVTQPYLPPLEELIPALEKIWESKIITNGGPFHEQFEKELASYLGVQYVSLFTNCTIGLITALQALRVTGEVITTPYSFVATAHSLLWNGIKPIFVDIDPQTFNIDPEKIQAAITPKTTAILAVHCYGNPCNVERIQEIADMYNLRVIYDAAHAFGVKCHCGSILNHGDLSVLSFHATKVFNTFEGGAIISPNEKTKKRIDHLKNFGFFNETSVVSPGINGKMSEFNAALGCLQLKHISKVLDIRKKIYDFYQVKLAKVRGIKTYSFAQENPNYGYYVITVEGNYPLSRDDLFERLKSKGIISRRYFYPLISEFPMYRGLESSNSINLPHAIDVASKVLCLPIYPELSLEKVEEICELIKSL